jgi:hypothetical protein
MVKLRFGHLIRQKRIRIVADPNPKHTGWLVSYHILIRAAIGSHCFQIFAAGNQVIAQPGAWKCQYKIMFTIL